MIITRQACLVVLCFLCCCILTSGLDSSNSSATAIALNQANTIAQTNNASNANALSNSDNNSDSNSNSNSDSSNAAENTTSVISGSKTGETTSVSVAQNNIQASTPFPWDEYFTSVVNHFTGKSVFAVEQDLQGDFTKVNLDAIFKIMRHFSIQDMYFQSFYSTDIAERTSAMEQASFYTKLILLGRGLVYLNTNGLANIKASLGNWLSYHDPATNKQAAKNLHILEEQANEFLAKSFLQPAPTDFSSAVRRSFEWCETLLDRINVIEEFQKSSGYAGNSADAELVVSTDFSTRCTILSIFERFCMLTTRYISDIENLSPEDFSDFLGGILFSISQITSSVSGHGTEPPLTVSQNSTSCLNYLISRTWYGYDYSPKTASIESDANAQKLISVKNFLSKLQSKTVATKNTLLKGGAATDTLKKTYSPLFMFIPDSTDSTSQSTTQQSMQQSTVSLANLLDVLIKTNLISVDDKTKFLATQAA